VVTTPQNAAALPANPDVIAATPQINAGRQAAQRKMLAYSRPRDPVLKLVN
jgi:hypothetical protein